MAHDPRLAERISDLLRKKEVAFETKRMMGGICFLVDNKMCVGVTDDILMVRFDPARHEEILSGPGCKPMDFTGRTFKGYVFVEPQATNSAAKLSHWIDLGLEFNPRAKRSKKRN